ncbi:MAG: hypothetical protein AAF959_15625 [Cyanobacteria bacterium P01_D01_bin.56]
MGQQGFWKLADRRYKLERKKSLFSRLIGFEPRFNERPYRNHPLSDEQKAANRERSKTRAKAEYVFGSWVTKGGGKLLRTVALARAKTSLGPKNLVYSLKRFIFLEIQTTTDRVLGSSVLPMAT